MNIEDFEKFEIELDYVPIIKETCEELAKNISQSVINEFDGTGAYAKSWTWKMVEEKLGEYGVVYNKEHYRLTHLLEHGHVIRNAYGTYGRTAPRPHIKPEFDRIKGIYIDKMSACGYRIKE